VLAGEPSSSTQSDYGRELLSYIERNKRYPDVGTGGHPSGVVRVLFTVTRGGSVSGVWIQVSSGSVVLDREAVATLLRSQPLPPIPANLPNTLNFSFDLEFSPPVVTFSQ
jgi:protein TonB